MISSSMLAFATRVARWLIFASEILLVGTGERVEMMPSAIRQYLNKAGVQIDVMNTVSVHALDILDVPLTAKTAECMFNIQPTR